MLNVVFEAFVCIINKQKRRRGRRRKQKKIEDIYTSATITKNNEFRLNMNCLIIKSFIVLAI